MEEKTLEILKKLEKKYQAMGQDLPSYLNGLLHADFITYWDYIHLDTLLSLQTPKTQFKDEMIFIVYHQITELYFKLILWELEQITSKGFQIEQLSEKVIRINRYFQQLIYSFEIMTSGMDPKEFLQFRMSLLPSSGFQSHQYRLIEFYATGIDNLIAEDSKSILPKNASYEVKFNHLYWKKGATELSTGKKTLTLAQFEKQYRAPFIKKIKQLKSQNLNHIVQTVNKSAHLTVSLKKELRMFDQLANVYWPLAHYKSAVRYLQKKPKDIAATGGTNWQKYLPPKFQRIIFFPGIWKEKEKNEWGKKWVSQEIFNIK